MNKTEEAKLMIKARNAYERENPGSRPTIDDLRNTAKIIDTGYDPTTVINGNAGSVQEQALRNIRGY